MKRNNNNLAKASVASMKVSTRKLSLVADMIRNMSVSNAVRQLTFCRKRIANEVKKCLLSAIANAENNNGMDLDKLYVYSVEVGKSIVLKRSVARARGRGAGIKKHFSKLSIHLSQQE